MANIKLAGVPDRVNSAANRVDDNLRAVWGCGMDYDAIMAVLRNDEEEVEGWYEDLISRLGVPSDVGYEFKEALAEWRRADRKGND